jgi:diadenosine tetraphosphatase ApaH/serine/threonine PP2A family protein phosphatase
MRVAVLADIHGNLPALDAVLNEIDAAAVDAIVLNGDIATGPMPAETLDRLAELGERRSGCVATPIGSWSPPTTAHWTPTCPKRPVRPPSTAHPGWIRDIGTCSPICHCRSPSTFTGLGPVRFCHATTRSDTEIVLVDSPIERYRGAFTDTDEPTIALGHTHMPFDRLAERRRFVNPGSVGMPYGARAALWALLGPDVALRRTAYDADVAAETFRSAALEYPGLAQFIDENVLTVPSDAQDLAVFSRWRKA